MASGSDHDVSQLNRLIETTFAIADGYSDAANERANSRFTALFRDRAAGRREIAERLKTRVKNLGGVPSEGAGVIQEWAARLKQKKSGSETWLVAAIEAAEDHVKSVYQKVIMDDELSDPVRTAVESELAQLRADQRLPPQAGATMRLSSERLAESVRDSPLVSIGIAAMVGFLIGRAC